MLGRESFFYRFMSLMRPIVILVLLVLLPASLWAQVHVRSPLPFGILQVSPGGETARLHFVANVDSGYTDLLLRIAAPPDSTSTEILMDWTPAALTHGRIDTILSLPVRKSVYSIDWHVRSTLGKQGTVTGLRAGHIFGIAGQSNAEGYNWDMSVKAAGDIRMLRDSIAWTPASEPTGAAGGGPWIVMGNTLWRELKDSLAIGIVNMAVGGTSLIPLKDARRWYRDPEHPEDTGIYASAVSGFRSAGGTLEALLWIQGESDGAELRDAATYHTAFRALIEGLREDLGEPGLRCFHLQISGNSNPGAPIAYLPIVREAHRTLPLSTLVGTAVGRSINSDGLHYTVPTYTAVGRMFGHAILSDLYGIATSLYPPVLPDTAAFLDSSASQPRSYFFRIKWMRGLSLTTALSFIGDRQAFILARDNKYFYDSSEVWSRVDPEDPSSVLVGLRRDSITFGHSWTISYIRTAGAEHAPLASIVPSMTGSGLDTIFATAFVGLPALLPERTIYSNVPDIRDVNAFPNPSYGTVSVTLNAAHSDRGEIELTDIAGRTADHMSIDIAIGANAFTLPTSGLPNDAYVLSVRAGSHTIVRKIVLVR
jgi:hypothetical protein